ncbi:MAG: helix-turn-helix transcriptional regulator [Oscillospiraceae bacterium]|nr:helix-turn-helix transcriptional regulator [Oscillospiraceae bacterium]
MLKLRQTRKGGEQVIERAKFFVTLKACRANANLTQEELAEALGVSSVTVNKWEKGFGEPNFSQVKKISELSHIPLDYILIQEPKEEN